MTIDALRDEVQRLVGLVLLPALVQANENENANHVHDPVELRDDVVSLVAGYMEAVHGSEATNVMGAHESVRTSSMYARVQHALSTDEQHQCQCGCPGPWMFISDADREALGLGDCDFHDCDHCLDGGGH